MSGKNEIKTNGSEPRTAPPKLTLFQQQESASLCRHVIETVGLYLASGIEMSIKGSRVTDQEFWRNLYVPTRKGAILVESDLKKRGYDADHAPENPFGELDFQACAKYLAFGWQRKENGGKDDSGYFCKNFGVEKHHKSMMGNVPYKGFQDVANRNLPVRNKYMHIARNRLKSLTSQEIWDDIESLKSLTKSLSEFQKNKPKVCFDELPSVKAFWEGIDKQCTKLLEERPIPIDPLGEELFSVTEMTREQRDGLLKALDYLGISEQTGRIYGNVIYREQSREDLMGRLRYVGPISAQLHWGSAAESPEEAAHKWEEEKAEREEERNRKYPVPEQPLRKTFTSHGLAFSGDWAQLGESEREALIHRFNILLDESVFLNGDGRNGVEKVLIPALKSAREKGTEDEKKTFVKMDISSVAGLFNEFRESKPLSAQEVLDWGEDAEEEQVRRNDLREACKKGIGRTLSMLKKENCLKVSPSLVGDEASHQNLCRLAEKYPEKQFLVLTFSEAVAEDLGQIPARNVVAARFARRGINEFILQIYDATRSNWVEMMGLDSDPAGPGPGRTDDDGGAANAAVLDKNVEELTAECMTEPAPPQAVPVPVPVFEGTPLDEGKLEGERFTVVMADGSTAEITLGHRIGFGGEGVIYAAAGQDGHGGSAVKVYKPANRTRARMDKLIYMIANDPGIRGLCWPQALVYSGAGEWVGFLMPLADGEPLAYTVYNLGENAANIREKLGWNRRDLVQAAANIADIFARMHRRGILMGDINPRNILADRNCRIWFVDCDSYQVGNFLCPVGMLQYIPPEVLREQEETSADYSYRRTEQHEWYSLAVLLFEILMLGKAPYVSRTNNPRDVRAAVLEGIFPYRFDSGEEDADAEEEEEKEARKKLERRGLLAPAGVWRLIWSNTTHQVKKAFYETFKHQNRHSAEQWKQTMEQYAYEIGRGNAAAELIPRSFKILPGDEGVSVSCAKCGKEFRMTKKDAEARRMQGKPLYCHEHYETMRLVPEFRELMRCGKCGKLYGEKVRYLLKPDFQPLCDDCGKTDARCDRCGTWFRAARNKKAELLEQGKALYCESCLYEWVECSDCKKPIRTLRFKYEKLCSEHEEFRCDDCRQRRRFAR